jgi:hypothetical protein
MVVAMVFHEQIGFDRGVIVGYTSMVLAFLMVYVGVRTYRDNVAGGRIGFGKAFKVGILITAVTTAFYIGTWQVVYYNFMPDYLDKYSAYALDKARAAGATDAELATQAAEMAKFGEMYKNPLVNIAFTAIEPLPVGILVTLVTAGVLSRGRKEETVTAPG